MQAAEKGGGHMGSRTAVLKVRARPLDRRLGVVRVGSSTLPCALGRSGIRRVGKREGDGATPAGDLALVAVLYRRDRVPRPVTALSVRSIGRNDGWCDDPADRRYNRPVPLPHPARCERLWRDDRLYDIVVVLDWNLSRRRPGRGSAIFLHLARPGFAPTEGCVAVTLPAMRRLLAAAGRGAVLRVV